MLSRKQMEETIAGGGSVLHEGRIITRMENLPSAASLARTDEEKSAAASDLESRIAALEKEKAELARAAPDDGKSDAGKAESDPAPKAKKK